MQPPKQETTEHNVTYNRHAALAFFKIFGNHETIKPDTIIFEKGQKTGFLSLNPKKMYLVVEGKVDMQAVYGIVDSVSAGEIFGEFTPHSSNTVAAISDTACKFFTLTEKQLLAGLKKQPEFVLMLMDVIVKYLRKTDAEVPPLPADGEDKKDRILNAKMLNELVKKLGSDAVMDVPQQRIVFKAGGSAMFMYVILEGTMTTLFGDTIVRRSGPGDIIGEIALIDQKQRTANVMTETHCSLLAINRQTLLELIKTLPSFGIILLRVLSSRLCLRDAPQTSNDLDDWDW